MLTKHNLTREKTIENHRKLWGWIAEQNELTDKNGYAVTKASFFKEHGIDYEDIPAYYCYACQYAGELTGSFGPEKCNACPIDWTDNGRLEPALCVNIEETGLYDRFSKAANENDMRTCAKIAKQIANLPEQNT